MANWNIDTKDWANPNATSPHDALEILEDLEPKLREIGEGIAILMHDRILSTIEILLPAILKFFEERNYRFVSMAECLGGRRESWYKPAGRLFATH